MKDLENYGVLEMNAREIKETEGGIIPLLILAVDVFAVSFFAGAYYELRQ
ncbi:class IIb bacteriocin, lactobin A/cerein 7B family [Aestuariivivens insulae]|nr:class IIb bacteriocin, lactobin A/cerein 7B family [Aestuariivivens insulae]